MAEAGRAPAYTQGILLNVPLMDNHFRPSVRCADRVIRNKSKARPLHVPVLMQSPSSCMMGMGGSGGEDVLRSAFRAALAVPRFSLRDV